MREQGFRYHTMADIERRGFPAVMEDVIAEANNGPEYIYVSFDIDVLDPAFVPGTGTIRSRAASRRARLFRSCGASAPRPMSSGSSLSSSAR